ncbi:MAG: DUF58 domain-containing protein [Deltaproteobacteria bacterium]|nr:DUF58 domain-containing protein [Deltaproteobacteria bacterium]
MINRYDLKSRFFVLLAILQLIGILHIFVPQALMIYLVLHVVLFAVLVTDRLLLGRTGVLSSAIKTPPLPELDQPFDVTIELKTPLAHNGSFYTLALFTPETALLQFDQSRYDLQPVKTGHNGLYGVQCPARATALGYEEINSIRYALHSFLGLWTRRSVKATASPCFYRVIPTKKRIGEQAFRDLVAHQRLFYQGTRNSIRGGLPEQFYSIRPYEYPDPLRYVDAKKTARYQTPMTRTYDAYYQHHVILAMDTGRTSMGFLGRSKKIDFYLAACLMLAQNAQLSHDRVSFVAFSQKPQYVIQEARNFDPFLPVFKGTGFVRPRETESDYNTLVSTLQKVAGQRSIIVILTDASRPSIQQQMLQVLTGLAQKHLVVVITLMDSAFLLENSIHMADKKRFTVSGYNKALYAYWVNEGNLKFVQNIARLGGGALFLSDKDWLGAIIRLYDLLRHSVSI